MSETAVVRDFRCRPPEIDATWPRQSPSAIGGLLRHWFRLPNGYASFGAVSGLRLPIIGKLLGHKEAATTQRYAHLDSDPLRRAANEIGEQIAAALRKGTYSDQHLSVRK